MLSEKEELEQLIKDWNETRLDIFAISQPDQNLDFYGVMRFYFQEPGAKDRKVATKCVRVNSSDTTEDVMKVLISKFHPDLKMLTVPNYSLYEVHETGTVCKLEPDQKPLYVQLYWTQSDRDGRFLLKSEDEQMTTQSLFEPNESDTNQHLDRRLSKREKKKREEARKKINEKKDVAKELYGDKPTSGLTRSLSNPEAVIKMRRMQRIEERLSRLQNKDKEGKGGGGPMRIFAESLKPETPYKTVLVSNDDTTDVVLKFALEKFEVAAEDMDSYCLTMVTIPSGNHSDPESSGVKERVVADQDCPLAIASSWPENKGELRFYLKKKENMPKRVVRGPRKKPETSSSATHVTATAAVSAVSATTTTLSIPQSPVKETTFDVENHVQEKEVVLSPAVHIVDAARDLPATLEFRESGEDAFFAVVISEVNGSAVHFKLAPTYTLYMCCRYRLSPKFRPDFSPVKRQEKVSLTAKKVANMMWQTVKENHTSAAQLAFWMANSSEFLHFLKQDKHLTAMTEESQKLLAHTTQHAFRSLVLCIKNELQNCLPAFLDPDDYQHENGEDGDGSGGGSEDRFDPNEGYQSTERSFRVKHYGIHGQPLQGDQWIGKRKKASRPTLTDVLHTLSSAMSLLRKCRVNAALTIQLFSQVFHYINMWIFNRLVLEPQLKLCTRLWGIRLLERLGRVQEWAENLGLELAAECHLGRVTQAAFLLQIPKQDSAVISSHCYKLNSLQVRQLLELYQPERDEPAISLDLIEKAVLVAQNTADTVSRSDGHQVMLEEQPDLHLPFLLPEDGYSSEQIRGVPPGLREFLEPLITPGLCRLQVQPRATGFWTVHFQTGQESPLPSPVSPTGVKEAPKMTINKETSKITINKGSKGMGVSIVAAKGVHQERCGIYVKEIVQGGPADLDGRLKAGDQILDVNGESLVGVQQDDAVKILIKSGAVVTMTVLKGAVWQDGLSALLNKPVNKVDTSSSQATSVRHVEGQSSVRHIDGKHVESPTMVRHVESTQSRVVEGSVRTTEPISTTTTRPVDTRVVEITPRSPDYSPQGQKKDGPRPPPRYRPAQEQRSPPIIDTTETIDGGKAGLAQKPGQRRPAYDTQYSNERSSTQTNVQSKTVVEYKLSDAPMGGKYRPPVPYASQQDIQRKQQEIQQRKQEEQRREQEERERLEMERIEKEEKERLERERIKREDQSRREREEKEQREKIQREEMAQRERVAMEQRERERIAKEQRERERIAKEQRERERIAMEQREREEQERKRKEERERIERESEIERRRNEERKEFDEMTRRTRELELMLEKERKEREERLQDLERQLKEQRAEADRVEREYRERIRAEQERLEQINKPSSPIEQRNTKTTSSLQPPLTDQRRSISPPITDQRSSKPALVTDQRGTKPQPLQNPPTVQNQRSATSPPVQDQRSTTSLPVQDQRISKALQDQRGTSGSYVPPVDQRSGYSSVEHQPRGNYSPSMEQKNHSTPTEQRHFFPTDQRSGYVPPPSQTRTSTSSNSSSQVHYVTDEKPRDIQMNGRRDMRSMEQVPGYYTDYNKRSNMSLQGNESFDMDPAEIERQFQQRLAQETINDEVGRMNQSDISWDSRDLRSRREPAGENRARVRVDVQRSEEERRREEMQWKREQESSENYRQQPVGSGAPAAGPPPPYPRQSGEWESEEEKKYREQQEEREENDRLREANANRLRNREIENPEDEGDRSYTNGRTRRVKFASVRTEITQPSPETELSKAEVKFVHDGKVEPSDDEEEDFPSPPLALQEDSPPPVPPPPTSTTTTTTTRTDDINHSDYYRPALPPKPQFSHADNESIPSHPRLSEEELRYATYPGRHHNNNNSPKPKPRVPRQSPSPDQAKLPFKDKMKMFNEGTPPQKPSTSKWERQWVNGEPL